MLKKVSFCETFYCFCNLECLTPYVTYTTIPAINQIPTIIFVIFGSIQMKYTLSNPDIIGKTG